MTTNTESGAPDYDSGVKPEHVRYLEAFGINPETVMRDDWNSEGYWRFEGEPFWRDGEQLQSSEWVWWPAGFDVERFAGMIVAWGFEVARND